MIHEQILEHHLSLQLSDLQHTEYSWVKEISGYERDKTYSQMHPPSYVTIQGSAPIL